MPREEAAIPGQPAPVPGASGAGVNGAGGSGSTGTSAGRIMRKGKHDMVSNAYTLRSSFIPSFHLASL